MKLLLLGGSGFLGSYTAEHLALEQGLEVLAPARDSLIKGGDGDLFTGIRKLLEVSAVDAVLNCIGNASIEACRVVPEETWRINVELPEFLAQNLPATTHLVHISSDGVFGRGTAPYRRSATPGPVTTYGEQKAEADKRILERRPGATILRASFFGLAPSGRLGTLRYFIDSFSRGEQVNGYLDYVTNSIPLYSMSQAILRAAERRPAGVWHLGCQDSFSKYEFGLAVAQILGFPTSLLKPVKSPVGFHSFGGLNISLDSEDSWDSLGLIQPTLQEGLVGYSNV